MRVSRAACCDCPSASKIRPTSSPISIKRSVSSTRRRTTTPNANDHEGFVTWKQCILVALGVLSVSAPAGAQYFGRNKVQYDRFDFSILQTPHFDIYYYDAEKDAARIAADMAERWYARLSVALDHT